MKAIRIVLGLLLTAFLAACGGGGGSPGGNPNQPTLVTTAGSAITVLPGSASAYGISGGVPPYRVQNSDTAIAVGGINGSTLTIGGVLPGTATVAVLDNSGLTVSIAVTVGASTVLDTTAPATLNLGIGTTAAQDYLVFGGVAPYIATSSNAGIVSTAVSGGNLRLTGLAAGTATVTVRDMVNQTKTINVTVGSVTPLYTTAQTAITVAPGANATRNYLVGGGTAPYQASSSNQGVASVSLSGTTLSITGLTTGTANVTVRDAANATVSIAVTVAPSVALYSTAPSAVTVAVGASTTYLVGGGVAPYTAASSNTGAATATLSGGSLTIAGVAAGSASVSVRDAVGSSVTIAVTVPAQSGGGTDPVALFTTAPSPVSVAVGAASVAYTIGGGTGPYFVTTGNAGIATVALTGTSFTITGVAAGTTDVIVTDSAGGSVSIAANVTTTSVVVPPLALLPSAGTGNVGDTLTFIISGGQLPYSAVANNTAVVTVDPIGATDTQMTVNLANTGTGIITVSDNSGKTVQLTVTVNPNTPGLRLSPSVLSLAEITAVPALDIPLSIYGGVGPYQAFSSDTTLIQVPGGTSASTTVTVTQAVKDVTADTAVTVTIIDSTGASAISTVTIKNNP
jgi:hypothetical protein